MSSSDNAKVSDSCYTTLRENGQSQPSSGNSLSKNDNKNQSESSGYCGGQHGSSNDAVQQPNNEEINNSNIIQLKTATLESNLLENNEVDHSKKQSEMKELMDVKDKAGENYKICHSTGFEHDGDSKINSPSNSFYTVVSLSDGIILHSTVSTQKSLGYSNDSWIGKSFIDYVDPQDQTYFAEKVVNNISMPFDEIEKDLNGKTINFYCRLRTNEHLIDIKNINYDETNDADDCQKYNKNKLSIYIPFYLNVGFKYFGENQNNNNNPLMMIVTIVAWPVLSIYKAPEEIIMSSVFSTRHTASCHLSFIDDDSVQYFGYLPQDIIGRSLFDFYHPDDLVFIKQVYETVVKLKVGTSFKSKPYRFLSQNGDYIMIETNWSSFINPWTDKLEFVTGHHRVLRGPINHNVFDSSNDTFNNIGDDVYKKLQIIESEIQTLLNKRIEKSKMIENKKINYLTALMDTIEQEIQHSNTPNISISNKSSLKNNNMRDHNYCDSKISSEKTPSYNHLNYIEKMEKFFNSDLQIHQDFTIKDANVNLHDQNSVNDNKKSLFYDNSSAIQNNKSSGSGEKLSNESNDKINSFNKNKIDNKNIINSQDLSSHKLPILTEALLQKHTKNMEKQMIQQHKEKFLTIKNEFINKVYNEVDDKSTCQKKLNDQKNGKKRHHSISKNQLSAKISKINDESEIIAKNNNDKMQLNKSNEIININCATEIKSQKKMECSSNMMILITTPQQIDDQLPSTSKMNQQNLNVSCSVLETKSIYPQVIGISTTVLIKNLPSIVITVPHEKYISADEQTAINTIDLSMHDSSDSSFYGNFISSSSNSNSSKEKNKRILEKRLDEMKNKCRRHFSMINGMRDDFKKQQKKIRNDLSKEKKIRNGLLKEKKKLNELSKKKKCLINNNKIKNINKKEKLIRMTPPWLEGVKITPDLTYRYQITPKPLEDILEADRIALNNIIQPKLVNEQFKRLCIDYEINQMQNLFIDKSDSSNNSYNYQHKEFTNDQE